MDDGGLGGETEDHRDPREAMRDSKRPVTPLAGFYGRPFHPPLAGIATGAWVCSFGFDLVSKRAMDPGVYTRGAYWLILVGVGVGLLAAVAGLFDALALPRRTAVFRTTVTHLLFADLAVVVFAASFVIRRFDTFTETPGYLLLLSVLGLGVLAASTWVGLAVSYRWGVRVADEADQETGYRRSDATADAGPGTGDAAADGPGSEVEGTTEDDLAPS